MVRASLLGQPQLVQLCCALHPDAQPPLRAGLYHSRHLGEGEDREKEGEGERERGGGERGREGGRKGRERESNE